MYSHAIAKEFHRIQGPAYTWFWALYSFWVLYLGVTAWKATWCEEGNLHVSGGICPVKLTLLLAYKRKRKKNKTKQNIFTLGCQLVWFAFAPLKKVCGLNGLFHQLPLWGLLRIFCLLSHFQSWSHTHSRTHVCTWFSANPKTRKKTKSWQMLIFPLYCTYFIVFLSAFLPRRPPDLTRSPNSLHCGQMSQIMWGCFSPWKYAINECICPLILTLLLPSAAIFFP